MKKKIFTLFAMMCCVVGLQAETVTKTWDFSEFTETVILAGDNYSIEYNGLTLVGNSSASYTSDYVSSNAGFHMNGTSDSKQRYIEYKPLYDGTITVTYRSNNSSATDRITAIGTKVVKFSTADGATSDVLAWGFTDGATEKTISADLTAGKNYYFYFANGGQGIFKLEYTYDDSGEAYTEPVSLTWDFSEYKTQLNLEGEQDYMTTYKGLTVVGNKTGSGGKDYLKTGAGFHGNGSSNTLEDGSIIRYIAYTPDYDGTLKVTFKSNNKDATDRITAIGTAVKVFNNDNVAGETVPEEVLAYDFANASGQTISAELTAGTTYYVYFATGGQAILKLEYVFSPVVSIPSAEYTTYVTPANVTFPENIKAYIVTSIGSTSVTISPVTNVPAKTPVILNGSEGDYTLSGMLGKANDVSANKLLASDGSVNGGEGIYALAKMEEVGFYPVKEGVAVPAGKAYLNTSAAVKGFLALEGEVTAINNVEAASAHTSTIYNVAGQKVQNIKASGLYIVNGKKVFVK